MTLENLLTTGGGIPSNVFNFLSNQDLGNLAQASRRSNAAVRPEINNRRQQTLHAPRRQNIRRGVFSGVYETGSGRNWADLHVTGELGGSMNTGDLVAIFKDLYGLRKKYHEATGIEVTLEWHPKGRDRLGGQAL